MICWNMDRITRNRRDTLRLLEVGQQAGATIALVRGRTWTCPPRRVRPTAGHARRDCPGTRSR